LFWFLCLIIIIIIIIIITWIYIAPFKQPKALYKLEGLRKGRKEKGIIIIIKEQKEK